MNLWMDKQIVVYAYIGGLFSNNKEQVTDKCKNMTEHQKHYAMWKKSNTTDNICMIPITWKGNPDRKLLPGAREW